MDRSRDQLLPCSRFAEDQYRGIGCGHFVDSLQYLPERLRGPDNLLKHEGVIELFTKCHVLVLSSLLILFSLVDVGACRIPTHDASLSVAEGIVVNQEPPILTVLPQGTLLNLKRDASSKGRLSKLCQPLKIVRVKDTLT